MELILNVGDTRPSIQATFTNAGLPVDLTAATSIAATLAAASGGSRWTRACTGNSVGVVTVPWQAGDTAAAGDYWLAFKVTWPDGSVQSFPPGDVLTVRVVGNI